jgi:hypothetical protein
MMLWILSFLCAAFSALNFAFFFTVPGAWPLNLIVALLCAVAAVVSAVEAAQ